MARGALIAGAAFGRYTVLGHLAEGGMGAVYAAHDAQLDRRVALKLLLPELLEAENAEAARARMFREAQALARLSHPNVVAIFEAGELDGQVFLAMEFLEGPTLRQWLKQKRRWQEVVAAFIEAGKGLGAAHATGLIHRDFKPDNVLMASDGRPRVLDFGLARAHAETPTSAEPASPAEIEAGGGLGRLTRTGLAMGTPGYMAPEQIRGEALDARSDQFNYCVSLYEALYGELPWKAPNLWALDQLFRTGKPPRPPSGTGVPRQVEKALLRGLEVTREKRWPSMNTLLRALAVRDRGDSRMPPSFVEKSWTGFKAALMSVGVLGLLVTASNLWLARDRTATAAAAPGWYRDTEGVVFGSAVEGESLVVNFSGEGEERLNSHAGVWKVEGGTLSAVQWGDHVEDLTHPEVVPRTYLAHRYYPADEFRAEVEVQVQALGAAFPPLGTGEPRYTELSFRIKDVQVSVFAIPGVQPRLVWRYFSNGKEVSGSSAEDPENVVANAGPMPANGKFRLGLELSRAEGGAVDAVARVDGQTVARKLLPGLAGKVAKAALGCRNLSCRFARLEVKGKQADRPASKKT